MNNSISQIPPPKNEPVKSYAPGSSERESLKARLHSMLAEQHDIPAFIGGKEIRTGNTASIAPPHDINNPIGQFHNCSSEEVQQAIQASMDARTDWMRMPWTERAAIFLKAAELLAGPWRDTLNAATMIGQSKNAHQAEIDAACELIDFLRFNAHYMEQIYSDQPNSPTGIWNRLQYRPLEGFVFAVSPFNFTAIQGNLPASAAYMGNTIVWKPASTSVLSAYYTYKLFEEAGLPAGVINMVPGSGKEIGTPAFASPHFAGLHFTGSTGTFQFMWKTIGAQIDSYRSYPRIVGETGGKDFIMVHPSAHVEAVGTAIVRGGFEYQGQKCSAASRVYIPRSLWPAIKANVLDQLDEVKMGSVNDFSNFINAVIDKKSYDNITGYIAAAKSDPSVEIIAGGEYSDAEGYFIEPTILLVEDPKYVTMCEELFGPVVTVFLYEDNAYAETLELLNETSPYALTGAIFSQDRQAIIQAHDALVDAAGNFYVNDKPTGAVVGQQPFGGARASGTNDKAGSYLNLIRWVNARTIKETFNPPTHFGYPYLKEE